MNELISPKYLMKLVEATVGLFLNSYYKNKFPRVEVERNDIIDIDDLPFIKTNMHK